MQKFLFVLCAVFTFTAKAQQKNAVNVTDLLNIKSLGAVTLSKDGTKAAFTVTSIEPDGESKNEYKYLTQIWMSVTDGSTSPKQLTAKDNSSQPAWSPDGKKLAFVRVTDGKSQIFILSLDGGEAMQLTKAKYGAGNPVWSPDGSRLAFSSSLSLKDLLKDSVFNSNKSVPTWTFEKPGFTNNNFLQSSSAKADPDGNMDQVRAYLDNNVADRKATVIDKLNFQSESDISTDLNFSHVFIQTIDPQATPILITKGFYRFNIASFTPDSKSIILTGNVDSVQHPDRVLESSIFISNLTGSDLHAIASVKGRSFGSASPSPDGKWLAFAGVNVEFVNIPSLLMMPLNGSISDTINIPFDRSKSNYIWSDDSRFIYFSAQSNGGAPIYKADVKSKQIQQLTSDSTGIVSFDVANNKMAFVRTQVSNPYEFYLADAAGKNEKKVSSFNESWLANKSISFPLKKSFVNEKGLTVEYWIMKPMNFQPGKKYPLLLEIHGGPSAMWGPGETSMWHEYQYFCSKGYGVVYCNPRGSGGYGLNFLRANVEDWGTGPTSDVLTALDKTIADGWADTSKLLITGGSYAGYLVAWIIAHDQRFKAACSQRGVYDLATFFGEGNAWRLVPNYFAGYPWESKTKAILERESPINYVQNINTPYLIFHGDNDRRTGFVQSEMLYRSLKILNKPVEYVRHPGGTHELTRSGNNRQRIDQMLRTWEFFERYVH